MPGPSAPPDENPWQQSRLQRAGGVWLFVLILATVALSLATYGLAPGLSPLTGVLSVVGIAIGGGIAPVLYLLAAFGWGRLAAARVTTDSSSRWFHQLSLGLGLLLWISHLVGMFGLLSDHGPLALGGGGAGGGGGGGVGPRLVGWLVVAIGLALVAQQVILGPLRPERWRVFPIGASAWAPAFALIIVAACNPPGSLWSSEHGAYDVLSYHLQLPKEWAAGERLWPVAHNIYSYLPSYVESAFMHLGVLSFDSGVAAQRMVGGESTWVYSSQLLHTGIGLIGAMLVARLVTVLCERAGRGEGGGAGAAIARWSGLAAGTMFLGTPWMIVVGSLAYNDLAVVAMLAASLLAAFDGQIKPHHRAMMVGWMMGIACSAKPTALFMAAPLAGLALLWNMPRGRWMPAALVGSIMGIVAMTPWLIRNAMATGGWGGNPVFPFATSLFGHGPWSAEQVARYTRAHFFDGSVVDRLKMLVAVRGFGHQQWAIAPWLGVVGLAITLVWRGTRRVGVVLLIGVLIQLVAWLFLTHIQSRFLVPLIVPASVLFGVGVGGVLLWISRRRADLGVDRSGAPVLPGVAAAVLMLVPISLTGWGTLNFMQQAGGLPNRLLVAGVGGLTGAVYESSLGTASPNERDVFFKQTSTPTVYLNLEHLAIDERARVITTDTLPSDHGATYLLGDAAPLYMLGALGQQPDAPDSEPSRRIIYHTTWDASPLGDSIRAAPDDPGAWSRSLLDRGIDTVLVNYPELARLIDTDHYFDADVTTARVRRWLGDPRAGLVSVRQWELGGPNGRSPRAVQHELFRIVPPPRAETLQ